MLFARFWSQTRHGRRQVFRNVPSICIAHTVFTECLAVCAGNAVPLRAVACRLTQGAEEHHQPAPFILRANQHALLPSDIMCGGNVRHWCRRACRSLPVSLTKPSMGPVQARIVCTHIVSDQFPVCSHALCYRSRDTILSLRYLILHSAFFS